MDFTRVCVEMLIWCVMLACPLLIGSFIYRLNDKTIPHIVCKMSLPIRKRKLDECSFPQDDNDDRKKKAKDCEQTTTESMVHVNDCTEEMNDINSKYSPPLVSVSEEGSTPTESSALTPAAASFVSTSTSDSSFVSTTANTTQNNSMGISSINSSIPENVNDVSFAVPMNMIVHRTYQQNPVPLPNNNTKDEQHNNTSSTTALARPRNNSIFSKILEPGTKVQTILLAGRNQNGLMGSIVEYNSSNERYTVEIDNVDGSSGSKKRKKKKKERMFLKRRNLKRLKESTASPIDNDVDTSQNTNDVSGFTIKTEIGIVQPEDESAEDISSMKISDLIKELDSYGVNTSNFHEKSELVDALKRAREIISRPPQDVSSIRQSKQNSQRMIRMMCLLGGILMLITAARYSLKGMNSISSNSNIKVEEEKKNVMDEEKEEAAEEKERNEMIELVGSILQLKSEDKKDAYYAILDVERNATHDDIKKAYRGRALKLHPDKDKYNTPNATQAFRAVGDVYDVLNDPSARKRYDKRRFSSSTPSSSPSSSKPGRDEYGDRDDEWNGNSYSRPRYERYRRRSSSHRPYFNYDDDYGYKHKNVSEGEIFWGVMKMYAAGFGIVGVWAMFIKEILWTGSW